MKKALKIIATILLLVSVLIIVYDLVGRVENMIFSLRFYFQSVLPSFFSNSFDGFFESSRLFVKPILFPLLNLFSLFSICYFLYVIYSKKEVTYRIDKVIYEVIFVICLLVILCVLIVDVLGYNIHTVFEDYSELLEDGYIGLNEFYRNVLSYISGMITIIFSILASLGFIFYILRHGKYKEKLKKNIAIKKKQIYLKIRNELEALDKVDSTDSEDISNNGEN